MGISRPTATLFEKKDQLLNDGKLGGRNVESVDISG